MTTSPVHILVAEDDVRIRAGLVDLLESEGYRVTAVDDGAAAAAATQTEAFDLVLLDIMMPEKSGYDVCREIRARDARVPIIMLTAKGEEIDKVVGLKLGADDYVTKPFGVHELLARIAAVLRRSRPPEAHGPEVPALDVPFVFAGARIDPARYQGTSPGGSFSLSALELRLIVYFHAHPHRVLSRDEILNAVWGQDYFGTTRTVDQHVAMIRKKVEPEPARPHHLLTVHGVGYRYEPDAGEAA